MRGVVTLVVLVVLGCWWCSTCVADPRTPMSRRVADKAHDIGQQVWDIRQKIENSDDEKEKAVLRIVLENMFTQKSDAPLQFRGARAFVNSDDGVPIDEGQRDDTKYREEEQQQQQQQQEEEELRPEDEPIVFLHIPRTGGRRFYSLLEKTLGGVPEPAHIHMEFLREKVRERDFAFLDQKWFYVHFDTTVITPFLRMLRRHGKRPRLVTFLRDPVDRLVSEYYAYNNAQDVSLEVYPTRVSARNRQVRFLGGKGEHSGAKGKASESMTNDVIRLLLVNDASVGFVECYEQSVKGIFKDLKLELDKSLLQSDPRDYSTARNDEWRPDDPKLLHHIEKAVDFDKILYNFFYDHRYCYCTQ